MVVLVGRRRTVLLEAAHPSDPLGGLGWSSLGLLMWLAATGVNTDAVVLGKGPWLRNGAGDSLVAGR